MVSRISQRNEQLWIIPATDDLVASSVTAREYALPDDVLNHIVTVEAAFDTAQATVFKVIRPYPGGLQRLIRQLDGLTEAKITNEFSNDTPYYFLTRRGIYIVSGTISVLTNGLKIRYRKYPADLASLTGTTGLHVDPTTTTFGVPLQVHELWARRISIMYKQGRARPIALTDLEKAFEPDFENQLAALSDDDLGAEIIGSIPDEDSPSILGYNV